MPQGYIRDSMPQRTAGPARKHRSRAAAPQRDPRRRGGRGYSPPPVRFCTVINKAWLAHARALAESLYAHQPEASLSVLVVDPLDGLVEPTQEPFRVVQPAELELPEFGPMSARYDVTALCCALKPAIIRHLLNGDEPVVYLDSDVRLFAPLEGLESALSAHAFLLTPHLLAPLDDDGLEPSETSILLAGSSNLGFAAAVATPSVEALLDWWSDRLRVGSRLDASHGLVYDQRWTDLMPGMFEDVGRWRDPGVNAGYWRTATSRFELRDGAVLIDGTRLRSFHFTGLEPERPDRLSRYDSRTRLSKHPVLAQLYAQFVERLEANGDAECRRWPYGFATTASGAVLDDELRAQWDRAHRVGRVRATPFAAAGETEFLDWLDEAGDSSEGGPINRYLYERYLASPELSERFPDITGTDRFAYLEWARECAERRPHGVLGLLQARSRKAPQPGLRELGRGETLPVKRGDVVVCIPVYGAFALFAECLTSVLAHTAQDVPILIADDASPDPAIREFVGSLRDTLRHEVTYLRQPQNLGFPGNVNAAFAAAGEADVVVLNSDCVVAEGWLDGLRRAAHSDALVATASALTNHGTIVSIPARNQPQRGIPQEQDLAHVAGAVREHSRRYYPTLPTAVGHCMYIRRQALDLVGSFDLTFTPGYGEEVDFSQRCVLRGLIHVAADDVFVLHHAGGSLDEDGVANPAQEKHERIIEARYPYYRRATAAVAQDPFGSLPRAIAAARRAITDFSVTIDGRCLGPLVTGTQVHTLELVKSLHATGRITVRVIVPPDLGSHAAAELYKHPDIELMSHTSVHPGMRKTDIAHRPYQVSNANDLLMLNCVGERQVITHQDLIAYRNPGYFAGYPQWERHRRLTREALALADRVVFFSHHALKDALSEDLVEPQRTSVVYIGVDHTELAERGPVAPEGSEWLDEEPFLFCLGTDFRHKNRIFALELLRALREEQGWRGRLVLAGPRVSEGSSAGEEAAYLATHPQLASEVLTLPAISEDEKLWLLQHCQAVVYPTTYEGFGLMPFEAAEHGRPCLFASHTALAELLPHELTTLVPWSPTASAARVKELLARPDAIEEHVLAIRRRASWLTWHSTAGAMIEAYHAAAASPAREAARLSSEMLVVEAERTELQRKYDELYLSLTPYARTLVEPDGPLSPDAQLALASVMHRPLLRRLVLAVIRLVYRASRPGGGRPAVEGPLTPRENFELHFAEANVNHMREQLAEKTSAIAEVSADVPNERSTAE
jgi:GT2 family glycosyltransferase/glycosyltransferase involved in cell wall biosynthesis